MQTSADVIHGKAGAQACAHTCTCKGHKVRVLYKALFLCIFEMDLEICFRTGTRAPYIII